MTGKLYGIGVGPGDPELLTLKALRLIKESDVIAVPGKIPQETVAYKIVEGIYPELWKKELLGIHMPMTKDAKVLKESHEEGVRRLCGKLEEGKVIAFLTLGDPTIYSTYSYLHMGVKKMGYSVEIVSGVPSFCAAAARMNSGIAEGAQQLHIIPASYETKMALALPGTKILMKAGQRISDIKEQLNGCAAEICMVENCGMDGEHIYHGIEQMPETAGYYTLVIVKERL
ncbi:MAG: precorrin-2 C(20)-methyltransferase [Dorea sp.]|nr:precorrin-2 C(20)-methyltransferase [Dorea sp.]